jgi:hypothetical protein
MARGWGRSEEDLEADKEQDRQLREGRAGGPPADERKKMAERRSLELMLAHIREQLPRVRGAERRRALETARAELEERLRRL